MEPGQGGSAQNLSRQHLGPHHSRLGQSLGADAIAIANSAMQAIGCIAMRACNTNYCPVGIATQKSNLRARSVVDNSARQLANYLSATTELMQVMARACGHHSLSDFSARDLTTWKQEMTALSGVPFAGASGR